MSIKDYVYIFFIQVILILKNYSISYYSTFVQIPRGPGELGLNGPDPKATSKSKILGAPNISW